MKIKARLVYVPDLLPGEELFQEILDPFTLIPHHIDFRMGLFQGIFRSLMYDFELFVDVMQCRLSYQYLAFTFLPNMLTSLLQVHVLVVLELQYIFLFHSRVTIKAQPVLRLRPLILHHSPHAQFLPKVDYLKNFQLFEKS